MSKQRQHILLAIVLLIQLILPAYASNDSSSNLISVQAEAMVANLASVEHSNQDPQLSSSSTSNQCSQYSATPCPTSACGQLYLTSIDLQLITTLDGSEAIDTKFWAVQTAELKPEQLPPIL
ncbi:hypothetical protein [Shewanella gelidii]|uniref:DUF2946 domain-containing protein n=1 Tax=Shewanella gelidii TaxID=1642821 RepID=A0A917JR22_9GAMM|nr:hypothetical protein [Shewanella gelidii]MCL1098535.1 hypothetical protein [Shewanella gelidii]GGI81970.1 hypothetical protein GCM10009332_19030 [Shewanella gelidii]